ncbi:MAG: glycosyltransferase family 2 protein [Flavobacterium sp.]|nr:glycosyltransferase family 2 protein [Flavobacterium sp.]
MAPELSVIIVNYNGLRYLQDCLESVQFATSGIRSEVIILDNNSTDESISFLKQNFPNVIVIESKINYGFGKGNNEAVKFAKGKFLLLLNHDTIVLDPLKGALEFLVATPDVGVVGINMLDRDKNCIPAAGTFPNVRNMFLMKRLVINDFYSQDNVFSRDVYEVDWLTGAFLLLEKKLFCEINGFDEDFFMYVEDVDFCKRIADKGLKRILLVNYRYIHFVGFNKSRNPMLVKGYRIYINKHFNGIHKYILLLTLRINATIKNLKSF